MKEKIFEPARHNEESPAKGMAAVNTFNPEEKPLDEIKQTEESMQDQPAGEKREAQGKDD
jgi:hypothetical protein